MNAQIAVIIPTYRRIESLKSALQSVQTQTLPPAETIVVDDNTDYALSEEVRSVTETYRKYLSIRYIQSNGAGGAEARNIGTGHAAADIFAFLDDDDIWYERKLEIQYKHIMDCKNQCEAVLTKQHVFDAEHDGKNAVRGRLPDRPEELLFSNSMPTTSTLMIKKNVFFDIGGFDKTLRAAQDRDLWLRLLGTYQVCLIDEPLCLVDMSADRTVAITRGENRLEGTKQFYNKWKQHPALSDKRMYQKYWFNYYNILAHRYSKTRNNKQAVSCMVKALRYKVTPGVIYRLSKFIISIPFDLFRKKDTICS